MRSIELNFQDGHNLAKQVMSHYDDPRDIGIIFSVAISTFLINAPDETDFDKYKRSFINSLSGLEWRLKNCS